MLGRESLRPRSPCSADPRTIVLEESRSGQMARPSAWHAQLVGCTTTYAILLPLLRCDRWANVAQSASSLFINGEVIDVAKIRVVSLARDDGELALPATPPDSAAEHVHLELLF